jgi:hypothetical protein
LNREDAKDTKKEVTPCPSKGGEEEVDNFLLGKGAIVVVMGSRS